jgi:hypothetical protein
MPHHSPGGAEVRVPWSHEPLWILGQRGNLAAQLPHVATATKKGYFSEIWCRVNHEFWGIRTYHQNMGMWLRNDGDDADPSRVSSAIRRPTASRLPKKEMNLNIFFWQICTKKRLKEQDNETLRHREHTKARTNPCHHVFTIEKRWIMWWFWCVQHFRNSQSLEKLGSLFFWRNHPSTVLILNIYEYPIIHNQNFPLDPSGNLR